MFDPEFDGLPSASLRARPKRRRNRVNARIHFGAALLVAVFGVAVLAKPQTMGSSQSSPAGKTARVAFLPPALEHDVFQARFEGTAAAAAPREGRVASAPAGKKGGRVGPALAYAELPETAPAPAWRPDAAEASAEAIEKAIDTAFAETPVEDAPLPARRPAASEPAVAEAAPEKPRAEQVAAAIEKPAKTTEAPEDKAEKVKKPAVAETGRKRSLADVVLASLGEPATARTKAAEETIRAKTPEKAKTEAASKPKKPKIAPLLGYAANDDPSAGVANSVENFFNRPAGTSLAGKRVAIYDIAAAKVYMPDGKVLEAHSGLGHMKDNPKYVVQKMNGPTPPDVYKLSMREKRFHGVAAIRMTPTDGRAKHGRTGFLAHTALVRGTNGSHGCVAFKDYQTFLKAFKSGRITHMVVVNRKAEAGKYLARL